MNDDLERAVLYHLPKNFRKYYKQAQKKVDNPKTKLYEIKNTGRYNAVPIPDKISAIIQVKDASKKALDYKLIHTQVVCSRNLLQPIIIEYIDVKEFFDYYYKILEEATKLRDEKK